MFDDIFKYRQLCALVVVFVKERSHFLLSFPSVRYKKSKVRIIMYSQYWHRSAVVVVVVDVSHIQRIGCQPEKTTLHGGQSRSWAAEQGKDKRGLKKKSDSILPPPLPPTLLVRRK